MTQQSFQKMVEDLNLPEGLTRQQLIALKRIYKATQIRKRVKGQPLYRSFRECNLMIKRLK